MDWADEYRKLRVRTNADKPDQAERGHRVRRRGHRPVPHRAHVLRSHRRNARDDSGGARRKIARRPWPSCCRSSGPISTGLFKAMKGRPVTIRTARSAAARVPAARRQGPGRDGHGDGRLQARSSQERVQGAARVQPDARLPRLPAGHRLSGDHRACRPGRSSRPPATCKKAGIEVDPEIMIPLVGFLPELKDQARSCARRPRRCSPKRASR